MGNKLVESLEEKNNNKSEMQQHDCMQAIG